MAGNQDARDRCSSCSPFGCGQHALPLESVAQRGAWGSWSPSNAHNRTTQRTTGVLVSVQCAQPHNNNTPEATIGLIKKDHANRPIPEATIGLIKKDHVNKVYTCR